MHYHAPSKQFTISVDKLQNHAAAMRFAIRKIREIANLPLEGDTRPVQMTPACHAEQAILDSCMIIGIDLGATRAGKLDVRNSD